MNKELLRSKRQKLNFLILPFYFCVFTLACLAQTLAPGAPGKDAQWASAGKQGIGTSASLESKIWFTLEGGAMTEVYYPDVTTANVHKLEFVVVNPKTKKVESETDDTNHEIKVLRPDSLSFQQINTAKSGEWKITKTYTIDPQNNSILISINYSGLYENEVYVYYDPSLGNSGMHDTAWTEGDALLASDGEISSALIVPKYEFNEMTNGFLGTSDGLEQLRKDGKLTKLFDRAENGNVVQLAHLKPSSSAEFSRYKSEMFEVILGFGKTSQDALHTAQLSAEKGFQKSQSEYDKGWADYVKTLPKVEPEYQAQFNMAAMQLKAHEDKTHRGANIASLTVPWGGGENANENNVGGYHLVWSRDLYQVATAYMALGDTGAANRALDFVFNVQQKPDGSVPQNSWLDGKPFWSSLQLDEVAFPLILSYQLQRFDRSTYENHVKRAADFIVKNGPTTPQERWEERSGYSPSTIAAEIAGLVCAAEIAKKNGDETSAKLWLKTADEWQANIEKWTATTNGKYGDGNYYLRITQKGNPNAGDKIDLGNGAGAFDEREIIDAGFLELVRLGVKSPTDPLIQKSLKVVDQVIKVNTPNGEGFYRYNHDGYGEMDDGRRWNFDGKYTGKGRLWALLSGERGQYELALAPFGSGTPVTEPKEHSMTLEADLRIRAQMRLRSMLQFANDGLMIPEQLWDMPAKPKNLDKQFVPELKFGEGTGSATPLAWSIAQFIRLAVNLKVGKNLDTPDIVYDRYVLGKKTESISKQNIINTDCGKFQELGPRVVFTMSDPRKTDPSPRLFIRKQEKESLILFTYFGEGKSVEIVGDFTAWKPCDLTFKDFSNSKILMLKFPNLSRFEYKLIVDGKWITDPPNPNKVDNGIGGENSFFTMPDYQPTTWDKDDKLSIEPSNPNQVIDISVPPVVKEFEMDSKQFGKRTIKVYLPDDYEFRDKTKPFPVLYFQDGSDYIDRAKAIQIQNNLAKAHKLQPFIMVFLDPQDRMKEYWANDDYAKFLATEIVPAIDKQYNTIKSRDDRAIFGASLGGITSIHTAIKYPEIFGRVGGQSSSFWVDNERVVNELEKLDGNTKFQFYLDDGTLEGVEDTRKVVKLLREKGFDVTYVEGETGHNWTAWRDRLADAFIAVWK